MLTRNASGVGLTANTDYTGTVTDGYRPPIDLSKFTVVTSSGVIAMVSINTSGALTLRAYGDVTTASTLKILLTWTV